jgi:exodeoxyribonuclease VII large subunit
MPAERGPTAPLERGSLTVAELTRLLRRVVEVEIGAVRVEGEVASKKEVASGHVYFSLKDEREDALVDCVLYRTAPPRARRLLVDGARVVVEGKPSVYVPRGRLQLIAEDVRPLGRGALLEALEQLKRQLAAEGLFAAERKRPLPTDPAVIGVVTSADGAAIHDIVTVAFRRGGVRILLARAPVQGAGAAERVARAIGALERVPEVEVIIVGRGGGSADDLALFNEELLVRKVAACRVPVVSAVGHEIDVTLLDLVADARAATPSQAAEMLVPDAQERARTVAQLGQRLSRAFRHQVERSRALVDLARRRLAGARALVEERQQLLDELRGRLEAQRGTLTGKRRAELARLERRLSARHPSAVVGAARAELMPLVSRLEAAMRKRLGVERAGLTRSGARLEALSPLAVLARGYAIAERADGLAVRGPEDVALGDVLRLRLSRGAVAAQVVSTSERRGERDV